MEHDQTHKEKKWTDWLSLFHSQFEKNQKNVGRQRIFILIALYLASAIFPVDVHQAHHRGKTGFSPKSPPARCPLSRKICEEGEAGNHKAVLMKWEEMNGHHLQVSALEVVVEAMVKLEPDRLIDMVHYLSDFALARPGTVHSLVSSMLNAGHPELAQKFLEMLEANKRTMSSVTPKIRKLILQNFALRRQVAEIQIALEKLDGEEKVSSINVAIRGFLEGGHKSLALQYLRELQDGQVQGTTASAMLAACNQDRGNCWHGDDRM